ncbi:lysine--tRNA ligase [Bacteroidia bacterium]|nr:lysine--tRNA ligase [Bacteroidia bacterium]
MDNQQNKGTQTQELSEILAVRRKKLAQLQQDGKDPFAITKFAVTETSRRAKETYAELEGKRLSMAGRIMGKRIMGKASFAHIQDMEGRMQLYVKRDVLGEEAYMAFKQLDIGDIIGVQGTLFTTKTGEISLEVAELTLLAKSLQPLPEKFHGLRDTDLRYRQRYLDMVVNPDVHKTFLLRSKILLAVRKYMDSQGFVEVETPILQTAAGGANARPFITHHNTLDIDMYLRIATELHLKRLVIGGMDKVYEMGRIFRNEGMSVRHSPEFTTIEVYQAYADYHDMMDLTERMIAHVARECLGETQVAYQGASIVLDPPFRRVTMLDAVGEHAEGFPAQPDDAAARAWAAQKHLEVDKNATWGEVLNEAFEEFVERHLQQPTFILDYPVEVSPLAKRIAGQPHLTERFELFITGREMANAFSELNDPLDQRRRFEHQAQKRAGGDDEAHVMDEDFLLALEHGMPPTGGMGLGIDRLAMLLTDSSSISDVILFPTMKPKE